jgi:hypothetical protein
LYDFVGKTLDKSGARKLKTILVGFIALMISGCGLPMPLSYLDYGRMTYDANQIIQDDATTADIALGLVTDMDCKVLNALEDRKVCASKIEKR